MGYNGWVNVMGMMVGRIVGEVWIETRKMLPQGDAARSHAMYWVRCSRVICAQHDRGGKQMLPQENAARYPKGMICCAIARCVLGEM